MNQPYIGGVGSFAWLPGFIVATVDGRRLSPGTSEKSFHTPVSLEDVKPEDFFGDIDDDNAGSELLSTAAWQ